MRLLSILLFRLKKAPPHQNGTTNRWQNFRIVNGYEPQTRPWMAYIQVKGRASFHYWSLWRRLAKVCSDIFTYNFQHLLADFLHS